MLDADYRRIWNPELSAVRPGHPQRVQNFMYACAKVAAIADGKMQEGRPQLKTRRPRRRRGRPEPAATE